jgi:hypothetical protein
MIHIYRKRQVFDGMGLAVLQPLSAVVEEELNGTYLLTLELPKDDVWCKEERIVTAPTPKNGTRRFASIVRSWIWRKESGVCAAHLL